MKNSRIKWLLLLIFLLQNPVAFAQEYQKLYNSYQDYKNTIAKTSLPFALSFNQYDGEIRSTVQSYLPNINFDLFSEKLFLPSQWCDIFALHINVKGCVYSAATDKHWLSLFVGPKHYVPLGSAKCVPLNFKTSQKNGVFSAVFFAADGPYGSKDYRFVFNAIKIGSGIFTEIKISGVPGFASDLAKIYFATIGRDKTGFSVVGKTDDGKPLYVKGLRGGEERNVVRYLFAIRAYFDSIDIADEDERYLFSADKWFDYTAKYPDQLYVLDKKKYLANKLKEWKKQIKPALKEVNSPQAECKRY